MQLMKKIRKPLFIIYLTISIIISSIIGIFFSNIASATVKITDIEFIGAATLPTGYSFQKTELGG